MTPAPGRSYRFASTGQWNAGLADRLVPADADGGLSPVLCWSARARSAGPRRPLVTVAVAPDGLLLCRGPALGSSPRAPVWLIRDGYADEGPVEVAQALATSQRLVLDGDAVWAHSATQVERFDRDTLSADRVIGIMRLTGDPDPSDGHVLDIAGAPCGGLWVLVALAERRLLVLLDRTGCVRNRMPLDCRLDTVAEVAGLDNGKAVALFSPAEQRIFIADVPSGQVRHAPSAAQFRPSGRWLRIASDGKGRLAVLSLPEGHCMGVPQGGSTADADRQPPSGSRLAEVILLLDRKGDILQPAFHPEIDGTDPPPDVSDLALARDRLVLTTTAGAFSLGSPDARKPGAEAKGGMMSRGIYLTPALTSLPGPDGEGWLRAEFQMSLPEGAIFTCTAAGTSDARLADRVRSLAADTSMTAATRLAMAWTLLTEDGRVLSPMAFAGPHGADAPVHVPLYGLTERMIWLRLDIEAPHAAPSPALRELRVLYPDASLVAMLPTMFRAPADGQPSALRDLVGVIETTTQAIDARIAGIGELVRPETAPPAWLERIARWTDIPWHDSLSPETKRRLVQNAGQLIRLRGTRRGLKVLLEALLPPAAAAHITDTGADYRPMVLGGGTRTGSPIPFLLAGEPAGTPRIGVGTVLGRARLLCGAAPDPLDALVPTVHVTIRAAPSLRRSLGPLLPTLLAQVLPASVRLRITWRLPGSAASLSEEGEPLDGDGPGALGRSAHIGRTVIAGSASDQSGSPGRETGFTMS